MEKIRLGNDITVLFKIFRDGLPESFVGASNINVIVKNEAYREIVPSTYTISGNVVTIKVDATDANRCGRHYCIVQYTKADEFAVDALAFEIVDRTGLTGGTTTIEGFIDVAKDGASAYEVWEAYPGNEGKTIEQYFDWLRENPTKIDLDGLNSSIKRLQFDTINPVAGTQAGQVYWSDEEKTLVLNDGFHTHPIGKELGPLVKNNSGQTILNGQACYVIGSTGDNPTIGLASTANGDVAQKTIGLATMDIPNNGFGIVTTFGEVNDINTSSLTQGGLIYLGLNGSLTTTEPVAPTPKIIVGICVRQHATVGKIFVATRPIPRLSKLSDVYTTTMANGEVLRWNTTTLRFEQFNLTTALDGKVNNTGNEGISGIKTFNNSPLMPTPTTSMQGANKGYVDSVGASAVHLTGNETIAGIKTFASSPIVPTPTTDMQASTKKYADDLNATAVHKTGAETIDGVKTFNASPIIPAPTTNLQPTTKKYVDDADTQLRADLNILNNVNTLYPSVPVYNLVISDTGSVRSKKTLNSLTQFLLDLRENTKLLFCPELGVKLRTSGVNNYVTKLYDISPMLNDAVQTTALNQPFLSGNIAPNEKYAIKNPNNGNAYLAHTPISFTATDKWSVSTVVSGYGNIITQYPYYAGQLSYGLGLQNGSSFEIRFVNNVSSASAPTKRYLGKNTVITWVSIGNGSLYAYINGELLQTFSGINTEYIESEIGRGRGNSLSYQNAGTVQYHCIRDIALSPTQVQDEYNYLRSLFPEIESVQIGTQTWATSNCEMTCTPQGNVIKEVTLNTTWADSTNVYNTIYANTPGTAEQKEYAAVKEAAMWRNVNNDPILASVYGKKFNKYARRLLAMDIAYYNAANPTALWGWDIPTRAQLTTLAANGGNALKVVGANYWNTANGNNATGFSLLGAGYIDANGVYVNNKAAEGVWCKDADFSRIALDGGNTFNEVAATTEGYSIRLIKV